MQHIYIKKITNNFYVIPNTIQEVNYIIMIFKKEYIEYLIRAVVKKLYLFIYLVIMNCIQSPIDSNNVIEIHEVFFDFDKSNKRAFFQVDIANSTEFEIDSVYTVMEYANDSSIFSKRFYLNDAGIDGDIIKGNDIYGLQSSQLDLIYGEQEINSVRVPEYIELSVSDTLYENIDIYVYGEIYNIYYTILLDNGTKYDESRQVALDNTKIRYYINSDRMCIDNDLTPSCDRDCVIDGSNNIIAIESNGYQTDADDTWVVDSYDEVIGSYLKYSVLIALKPLDSCGGTGYPMFKFELSDYDNNQTIDIAEGYEVPTIGCGDGWCTPDFENYTNCPEDCND